jgi:hypothetical protein
VTDELLPPEKRPCHVTLRCDVCGSMIEAYGDTMDHATAALDLLVLASGWRSPRLEDSIRLGRSALMDGALSVRVTNTDERDRCPRCLDAA